MEILALIAVFVVVYLVVTRFARKRAATAAPIAREAAIETWAKSEVCRVVAEKLQAEESELSSTLSGNPDPDLVTKLEKAVASIDVVYERALDGRQQADVRVEIRFESGDIERSLKRIPWGDLPDSVRDEFAKTGTAHVYKPWLFPWQR